MMTEKEAWEKILLELQENGGGWLCHSIDILTCKEGISYETRVKMMSKIEAVANALHIPRFEIGNLGLWDYCSSKRIAWVKKQIKKLEEENVSLSHSN